MKTQHRSGIALLLALALVATACGGGGGNDDDNNNNGNQPLQRQDEIPSSGNLDGIVTFNNAQTVDVGQSGGTPTPGDGPFAASGGTLIRQGLWSFDISGIPSNATITGASLRLVITNKANEPDAMMVIGRVDHVNYGGLFPPTAGALALLESNFAQIQDMDTQGERVIDVTAQVQADFADAGRTRSQFRVRGAIQTNLDGVADFTVFSDADTNTGIANADVPTLTVDYTVP